MSTSPDTGSRHRPPPAAILLVPVIVAAVLALFAWPSARLEPRDLPIGVAGPPAAARTVEQRLAARGEAFDVHRYPSEAAARQAIRERDVYGAFVAEPSGIKVLTASAASGAVGQLLTHAAQEGPGAGRATQRVEDVVPAPRGAALASSVLPLMLVGIITGVLAGVTATGFARRAGLLLGGSVLAGLTGALVVQSWLDVVGGEWLANAGALRLTVLAIAATVTGLYALLGERGVLLGALTMVLVGNPSRASAPRLSCCPSRSAAWAS
jgi:ABC-2 family transporter